jgi:hypothetical protein
LTISVGIDSIVLLRQTSGTFTSQSEIALRLCGYWATELDREISASNLQFFNPGAAGFSQFCLLATVLYAINGYQLICVFV